MEQKSRASAADFCSTGKKWCHSILDYGEIFQDFPLPSPASLEVAVFHFLRGEDQKERNA